MLPEQLKNDPGALEAVNQLLPYRGETVPMPNRYADTMPDHVWERIHTAGDLASEHLLRLLQNKGFSFLPIKDQVRIIELSLTRAYGGGAQISKHVHLHGKASDQAVKGVNALSELSRKATRQLPEFVGVRRRHSPIKGKGVIDIE